MIRGTIRGQSLRLSYPTLVSDSVAYLTATFSFLDDDWNDLEKWVLFTKGEETFGFKLTTDRISAEDGLNLPAGQWMVSVMGAVTNGETVERRITTKPQILLVEQSGALEGDPLPVATPDIGEQLLAMAVEAKNEAKESEESALQCRSDVEAILRAIIAEQERILAIQEKLIGGDL